MNCCGNKRHQWQQNKISFSQSSKTVKPVLNKPVKLIYHGSGSQLIKGEHTGLFYLFGETENTIEVEKEDVPSLLKMGNLSLAE